MMKVHWLKLVSFAAVAGSTALMSGCVTYGNTHALITPVGVAGYHSFKPANKARDIQLPQQRDPNQIAAVKAKEEQAADRGT